MHENNLSALPLEEQAKRYRILAGHALREAMNADGEVRETYILLAQDWQRLAMEAEEEAWKSNRG